MKKILYSPQPGTTGFFLGEFPELLNTDDFEGGGSPLESYYEKYDLEMIKCKEEAIKNGEIVNPELLESTYLKFLLEDRDRVLLYSGDLFDLPEGLQINEFMKEECPHPCPEYNDICQYSGCLNKGIEFSKKFIRLVPSNKEEKTLTDVCPLPNECCSPNCNCSKEEKEPVKQDQLNEMIAKSSR